MGGLGHSEMPNARYMARISRPKTVPDIPPLEYRFMPPVMSHPAGP